MSKVCLTMIVKGTDDEYHQINRALNSIVPFVDAAYVTITAKNPDETKKVQELLKKKNCNVSYKYPVFTATKKEVEWLTNFLGFVPNMKEGDEMFLFDEARNFNLSQVPKDYDWIIWIDSDDILQGGEFLKRVADVSLEKGYEAVYLEYLYQVEYEEYPTGIQLKHVLIKHLRERLVRNNGAFKWIAPIHETLIEQRPSVKFDNYDCQIVHLADDEKRMKSLTRNLRNLELAIYQSKGKDPRHVYYLAKALFDIRTVENDKRSLRLIKDHYLLGEHKSGWPEERGQAWEYAAEILKRTNKLDEAINSCLEALKESPETPTVYLNLASCYMLKQQWERALFWVEVAAKIPEKKSTLVVNPKDTQGRTLEILYNCYINLRRVDEAHKVAVKLKEMFPDNPNVQNSMNFIERVRTERELTKSVVMLADYLKNTGERPKIRSLLNSIPQLISENPFITGLVQQNLPPKYWQKDEIAIYCGPGYTNWSPKRMVDPKEAFVGGSEEAVIMLAKSLAGLGWRITVFADPGADEGEYDGVKWLPYYKFNRADSFNILIGWRDIRFFDTEFKAKKTYLWCHDIQNQMEYTKERVDRVTKFFFLSQWHRDNVPALDESKVMITSNGI